MKPSELKEFTSLPDEVIIYRAKRPSEMDWIAYTLDIDVACRLAKERGVAEVHEYCVPKKDITALFLRRKEQEVIILDKELVKNNRIYSLVEVD